MATFGDLGRLWARMARSRLAPPHAAPLIAACSPARTHLAYEPDRDWPFHGSAKAADQVVAFALPRLCPAETASAAILDFWINKDWRFGRSATRD
jgi:hypothetical protein